MDSKQKETIIDGIKISLNHKFFTPIIQWHLFFGTYERKERKLFHKHFPKGLPVIELGAGIGVVSCIVNRQLSNPHYHLVVEANPKLLKLLKKHRDRNNCQFQIIHSALGYGVSQIEFNIARFFLGSSVQQRADMSTTVPANTLQSFASLTNFEYFNLICDIEFGEVDLVKNEIAYLREHVGWFLVETHPNRGRALPIKEIKQILETNGFEVVKNIGRVYCYRNTNQKVHDLMESQSKELISRNKISG